MEAKSGFSHRPRPDSREERLTDVAQQHLLTTVRIRSGWAVEDSVRGQTANTATAGQVALLKNLVTRSIRSAQHEA